MKIFNHIHKMIEEEKFFNCYQVLSVYRYTLCSRQGCGEGSVNLRTVQYFIYMEFFSDFLKSCYFFEMGSGDLWASSLSFWLLGMGGVGIVGVQRISEEPYGMIFKKYTPYILKL